jgi:hypothetical protein
MSLRSLSISLIATIALSATVIASTSVAGARPKATPTPVPTPTPVADPGITKLVVQQFVAWQAGNVNKTLYAPAVLSKLTDDKINQVSHALGTLGALTGTVYIGPFSAQDVPADAHGYIYQMQCREGNVYLWMIIDGQGKIATIFFKDRLDTEEVEVPASAAPSPTP